jgi:hypothetical protein
MDGERMIRLTAQTLTRRSLGPMLSANTLPYAVPPTIVCCFTSGFWVYRSVSTPSHGRDSKKLPPPDTLKETRLKFEIIDAGVRDAAAQGGVGNGGIREPARNGNASVPTDIPLRLSRGCEQATQHSTRQKEARCSRDSSGGIPCDAHGRISLSSESYRPPEHFGN